MHALPKCISTIENANSLVQDPNSVRRVPLLQQKSLHYERYQMKPIGQL